MIADAPQISPSVALPPTRDSDQRREWFAFTLPVVMALLLALVPVLGTGAKVPFLLVLVPLFLWAALRDTERALYVYIAWCWMDGTIRGVFDNAPVMIVARDILLGLIVVGWGLRRLNTRSIDPLRAPPINVLIILFIINAVLQIGNPYSLGLVQSIGGLKIHLGGIPLLYIGYDVFRRRGQVRSLLLFLTLATLVIGAVSYVQYAHGKEWTWSHFPGTKQVISQNYNPSAGANLTQDDIFKPPGTTSFGGGTGGIVGEVFPLAFALLLLTGRLDLGKKWKSIIAATLLAFTIIIFVNGLRSAIATATVGVLICTVLMGGKQRGRALATAGACLVLGFVGWSLSQTVTHGGASDRFGSTFAHPQQAIQSDRQTFFEVVGPIILESPIGCGLGRSGAAAGYLKAGNNGGLGFSTFCEAYLGTAIFEMGILGALLISAIAAAFLWRGWKALSRLKDPDDKVLAAGLLTVLIIVFQGCFSGPALTTLPGFIFFWLFGGILLRVFERPTQAGQILNREVA